MRIRFYDNAKKIYDYANTKAKKRIIIKKNEKGFFIK